MLQMTIIFSLVLFLLFLSLHACNCNARNLGVPPHLKSQYPITKEKDEKVNEGCVPMRPGAQRTNWVAEEKSVDELKNSEVKDDGVIKGSDFRKKWRVPHRKRGEREAGFSQDYLPPKTHPPVHN